LAYLLSTITVSSLGPRGGGLRGVLYCISGLEDLSYREENQEITTSALYIPTYHQRYLLHPTCSPPDVAELHVISVCVCEGIRWHQNRYSV